MIKNIALILLAVFLVSVIFGTASAMQLAQSFDQIVQSADLIFMGEVIEKESRYTVGTKKEMILTDYTFLVNKIIFSKNDITDPVISLTFAGGKLDKEYVVTGVPILDVGSKYIVFSRMDGRTYANPVIGGFQGLFTVITDNTTGISYPLRNGKHPVTGIVDNHITFGPGISRIQNGIMEAMPEKEGAYFYNVAPTPAPATSETGTVSGGKSGVGDSTGSVEKPRTIPKATVSVQSKAMPGKVMNVDEFIDEINKRIKK